MGTAMLVDSWALSLQARIRLTLIDDLLPLRPKLHSGGERISACGVVSLEHLDDQGLLMSACNYGLAARVNWRVPKDLGVIPVLRAKDDEFVVAARNRLDRGPLHGEFLSTC